jgi:hypothetical protein
MPSGFSEHPRKRVVREKWDTPVLQWLSAKWQAKYFYFGLPGPDVHDIRLWRSMIRRVLAFELESETGANPRTDIEALNRNLTFLRIPYSVYVGPMEEVVLDGQDRDGVNFSVDEFVTLFNLDFCGPITQRIETTGGRRCLRFEAIRAIVTLQRALFRKTGQRRFLILLTVHDAFHVSEMDRFVSNPDMAQETKAFVTETLRRHPLRSTRIARDTALLRAFVFSCLRDYLRGHNVGSVFLPPVSYMGTTAQSPMVHFLVVCTMQAPEAALVVDRQCAGDFLQMNALRATDNTLEVIGPRTAHRSAETDPVSYLATMQAE